LRFSCLEKNTISVIQSSLPHRTVHNWSDSFGEFFFLFISFASLLLGPFLCQLLKQKQALIRNIKRITRTRGAKQDDMAEILSL